MPAERLASASAVATSSIHPPYGGCEAPGHLDGTGEPAVPGGVAGALDAEHALAAADLLAGAVGVGDVLGPLVGGVEVGAGPVRRSGRSSLPSLIRPFIWLVGSALRPAVSVASISARRLTPSLVAWIWSCSLRIASISISGRGGQPGRYMSTGTMWSTPWTIA